MPSSERESRAERALRGLREHRSGDAPSLPRYEIRGRLGEGATSVVYDARDRELNRAVALKVLREAVGLSETARERFRREAQAAAGLSHPNVVTVFDAGEDEGRLYLVLERISGSTLRDLLLAGGRDRNDLLALLEKAARGVGAAHERGIVHRDLKPANILLAESGEPKVADFGLAHLSDAAIELTRTGAAVGTPLYMAPEQAEGKSGAISPRTDVYALGAILYEVLTGRTPHAAETTHELYAKIVREEVAPPRKVNPDVPRSLEIVALKALSKDPARRYPDAAAFADDLRRFLDGRPVEARPVPMLVRLGGRVRRHPTAVIAAVLLAAALSWILVGEAREKRRGKALALLESARPPLEKAEQAMYDAGAGIDALHRPLAEAERRIEEALALSPDLALAHYRRGEAWEVRGYFGRAGESWRRACALDPRFGPARYRLGRLLLGRAYLASLDLALEPPESARERGRKLAAEATREIEAARQEGSGFDHELQREAASAMLAYLRSEKDTVRRICADGIRTFKNRPGVEEFHWLLGLVAARGEKVPYFDRALELRPMYPLALFSRGRAKHQSKQDAASAVRDYDAAIALSPPFVEAYIRRGSLKYLRGDAEGAIADYEHLMKVGALLPAAYNGRGYVRLTLQDDVDGALEDLDRAVELNADYRMPYPARAEARFRKGDFRGAIEDATRALSIYKRPDMYFIRGRARAREGDPDGAIVDLEEAVRREPGNDAYVKELKHLKATHR